jgi:uncharacterized protein YqcC (DUF446 family)
MDKSGELAALLMAVANELHVMGLWQEQNPAPEALASVEPFAVDQLSFSQWLQFIFLPRMEQLIEAQAPLPQNCSIAPMAEESFTADDRIDFADSATLVAHLAAIDQLLTER